MDSDPRAGGGPDIPAQPPAAPPPGPILPPGTYPPPPPPPRYPASPNGGAHADIPASSPEHGNQEQRRGSSLGWLGGGGLGLAGLLKYVLASKVLLTAGSALLSYGAYAWYFGSGWAALGLVVMILVHEMGHVVEIQRQGLRATAPVFIPFVGAAIFQREHPTDAVKQAQIGIAGPIAGTIGATVAWFGYGSLHWYPLLFAAAIGFLINLVNLIPASMLDGGWILAPVSKWLQVAGLALIGALALTGTINFIFVIVVILGLPATIARFQAAGSPYYTSVPAQARWALGISWLALVVYLLGAMVVSGSALDQFVR